MRIGELVHASKKLSSHTRVGGHDIAKTRVTRKTDRCAHAGPDIVVLQQIAVGAPNAQSCQQLRLWAFAVLP